MYGGKYLKKRYRSAEPASGYQRCFLLQYAICHFKMQAGALPDGVVSQFPRSRSNYDHPINAAFG
jgi:hypothetical protein